MEIQKYKARIRVVEKYDSSKNVESKDSLIRTQSMFPGKEVQTKYICEKIVKDCVALREVCTQQAVILISQVH